MSRLKEDVKEMQKETKAIKKDIKQPSLAMQILKDIKRENQALRVMLIISILVNVVIAMILV